MSALLTLVPWWGRWLMLLALIGSLIAYGYVKGYLHEERKLDIFEAQVQVLAQSAERHVAELKASQDKTTKEIRDAHAHDVSAIRAYYARRLRDADASRSAVPAAADRPREPDGAAAQCRPGDEGDQDVALIELESRAALDAEKVLKLQDFIRANGFPVR